MTDLPRRSGCRSRAVHSIRLEKGMGFELDEKAAEALSHWRFKPAMVSGKPIPKKAKITINFDLP
ncbi:MAG TPA: TonB family protein [Bryobacteraceae bacterium]|nr:TonB family protein [Bryobacteraceae bacterium]